MKRLTLRRAALMLALLNASLAIQSLRADPFLYQSRDLLLCFRKTGGTGGTVGSYDFEVNIGQVSNLVALASGSTITNTQVTPAQLAGVFDNLNDLSWSVSATAQRSDGGDPTYPFYTLWTTAPRTTPETAATAWTRASQASQGNPAGKIASIGSNARTYSSSQTADPLFNTAHAVRVPAGNGQDYGTFIGQNGNYANTFQGNVENVTPSDFSTAGSVSRSDLYQLLPSSSGGDGTYLGYFELRPNGAIVFVRAGGGTPPPPPPPQLAITRSGNVSTISFATTNGALYDLRFTNVSGLAAPITTWPAVPNVVTGDGTIKSTTNTTTDPNRVYRVVAH